MRPRFSGGRLKAIKPDTVVAAICGAHVTYPHHATVLPDSVTCPACKPKAPR